MLRQRRAAARRACKARPSRCWISASRAAAFFSTASSVCLTERYGVASVIREMKPTFAKPAPAGVIEKIRGADAVIEALAD